MALTPEAFGQFLRWLSEVDEVAVKEYLRIRNKLVRYFIQKGCADPDVLFDRVVDIVVGKIDGLAGCFDPLKYCYGVAKNVWRQDLRERKPMFPIEDVASPQSLNEAMREHELECLDRCIDQLSPLDRSLIILYYQGQGHDKIANRSLLAGKFGGPN